MPQLLETSIDIAETVYRELSLSQGQLDPQLLEHILTEVDGLLAQVDQMLKG